MLLKATTLGLVLGMIAVGGFAVYFYTLPPSSGSVNTPPAASAGSSSVGTLITNQASGRQSIKVEYNGTTYQVPAKGPNSPTFSCPTGTDPALCTLLQETCGNGIGPGQEPWKNCYNCIFDAGCTGNNSCDPYTHQCSSPASACMVIVYGNK